VHDQRTHKMSFVEGLRVDIYFLGIIILKMLGKMRVEEGDNHNMTYLLQISDISMYYEKESLSPEMINFLTICFYDPQITVSELLTHNLISENVMVDESMHAYSESPSRKMTIHETSSKRSGSTTTSKVLKRYLTNGTHEGSSSEFRSDTISNFSLKTKSVVYEDSSFILKKLQSLNKRKTTTYGSGVGGMSRNSVSKFLKNRSLLEISSISSSSPAGSLARPLDRMNSKNRIILGEGSINEEKDTIREEPMEDEDYVGLTHLSVQHSVKLTKSIVLNGYHRFKKITITFL